MLPLFALTIFLGAALLFLAEPLAAKLMLPLLGGTPAVWNTCMVFFQAMLLAGYLGAHLLGKARPRVQTVVYPLALAVPVAVSLVTHRLILGAPPESAPPASGSPITWLLTALTFMLGGPFLAISAAAPLLQRWFSTTGHRAAKDPYFLYAASNAGSMLGLLGYPFVVEPSLTLSQQRSAWSIAFGAFAVLVAACAAALVRGGRQAPVPALPLPPTPKPDRRGGPTPAPSPSDAAAPPTLRVRAVWLCLAFIPSSLTLGVTQHLSTDVAAAPLLWVMPLTLYLLTFIIAFSRRPIPVPALSRIVPLLILGLPVAALINARSPAWALTVLHLVSFSLCSLLCHTRLAALRPGPSRLTEFYLLIALGGVLGGMFNALVAPLLFTSIVEYPLVIVLALLFRTSRSPIEPLPGDRGLAAAALALLAALLVGLNSNRFAGALFSFGLLEHWSAPLMKIGIPAVLCYLLSRSPRAFAAGVGIMFAVAISLANQALGNTYSVRTFFGVYRVAVKGAFSTLVHSTTTHGIQCHEPRMRTVPLGYYSPGGPIGDVFQAFGGEENRLFDRVGLVGLGAGALAAYGRPGQDMTFHEIDPAVVAIARNPAFFTYLQDSAARTHFVLGDGRLTLGQVPDGIYGLILLDAFSSDAIPIHLITREAVALYLTKLDPRGLIAFHISNHFLDLSPVLARIAGELHLVMVERNDQGSNDEESAMRAKKGVYDSTWVVLARDPADFGPLTAHPRWRGVKATAAAPLWTDDYSNILSVFQWN